MLISRCSWNFVAVWQTISVVAASSSATLAEDPLKTQTANVEVQEATERITAELTLWKFRLSKDSDRDLTLVPTPILRWTNPTVGRVYGNVYVITNESRPQAIISPYKWFEPYRSFEVECLSVATTGIQGTREEKSVWSTTKPGLEWRPVPGNPTVGTSNVERQRQMKKLASQFTAELLDTRSNEKGEDQQLRQLTQPVYRYESPAYHVVEGGVFAFVVGTDPEVFLLLEAVETGETTNWHYGLARMNSDQLSINFQDKKVWQIDRLPYETYRDAKQPYFCRVITEE